MTGPHRQLKLKPQPLYTAGQIDARVTALAQEIRKTYGDAPIHLIGVLRGAFIFLADLARALGGNVTIDFVGRSSYAGTNSTGAVTKTFHLANSIAGKHVLIVEDIVDTGNTARALLDELAAQRPASLRFAAFLDKPARREVAITPDFIGFTLHGDPFVVGYGLDCDDQFRALPYVGEVEVVTSP